ncbi:DAZ-associated protein 2 isoform X2 [Strongylocentrotus purpuratus]|uniref:DAZ-associated protein 2 n=1 Tax=Strongylocentrotus purpuratus TaxID=7668 RepID=A0A7M7LLA9_STRPU|nr:DAZ-associated protein 2 isoform X2 [Strongylocentrotus purpuratus]|eukprot:XP_003726155.1 PREDICTED: DAZ-associated protein 2 isoform X2 [Strongylocentrotus purpuratus]
MSQEKDGKKPYPVQQAAYPTQQAAYPQGAAYPAQQPYNPQIAPVNQQHMYSAPPPGAGGYAGAPPPYSAAGAPPPAAQAGYPQAPVYYQPPQPQTVVVNGGYDAGARFNSRNPPSIPPPPPGCAPNAAQMASGTGQNVVMGQKPSNWVTGGSDGGYTLW